MSELQVRRDTLATIRLVDTDLESGTLSAGEVLAKVDQFAFTANNVTYGVVGEQLGYWKFFPPAGEDVDGWGIIPVWGFADIVASNVDDLPVGERLFGYFPPASHLLLRPGRIREGNFFDTSPHRAELPAGYNNYRRVSAEPGYDRKTDALRMLFYPLHVTSFCLADVLQLNDWYGAEQVVIVSASSKTSIGLAYGLDTIAAAPRPVAVTSAGNRDFVESLDLYAGTVTYDRVDDLDATKPAVLVDMSGNDRALNGLASHLGDNMLHCIRVGVTHHDAATGDSKLERSSWFFAPSHIEQRMKDWGPDVFQEKSTEFIQMTSMRSRDWLNIRTIDGLAGLQATLPDIIRGKMSPAEGLIVRL